MSLVLALAAAVIGSCVTWFVMRRREHRAERAQELLLAERARLDEPDRADLPSWLVLGWHKGSEDLTLATASLSRADFSQETSRKTVQAPGFRRPLRLEQRRCRLEAEFTAYTLLHGQGDFDEAVSELRTVWQPRPVAG
jgi:hypothetical protein